MSAEKVLTKEIAEQFLADEDSVELDEFTAIEDAAAVSLSKHKGKLQLDGLESISDSAAKALMSHSYHLSLDGIEKLSLEAANYLSQHVGGLSLSGLDDEFLNFNPKLWAILKKHPSMRFCYYKLDSWVWQKYEDDSEDDRSIIEDLLFFADATYSWNSECNEPLGTSTLGEAISFFQTVGHQELHIVRSEDGTEMAFIGNINEIKKRLLASDIPRSNEEVLTKEIADKFLEDGSVDICDFTAIEDEAAESLSKHKGESLELFSLESISDAAAESLSKYEGELLDLYGLIDLSDVAAESLSKYKGELNLDFLIDLSDAARKMLVNAGHFADE